MHDCDLNLREGFWKLSRVSALAAHSEGAFAKRISALEGVRGPVTWLIV